MATGNALSIIEEEEEAGGGEEAGEGGEVKEAAAAEVPAPSVASPVVVSAEDGLGGDGTTAAAAVTRVLVALTMGGTTSIGTAPGATATRIDEINKPIRKYARLLTPLPTIQLFGSIC
jgi:hypothetical protein